MFYPTTRFWSFLISLLSATVAPAQQGPIVFDIDFTKGRAALPSGAKVVGGQWRSGWEPDNNGQRIIIDPGRALRNGVLEVTFTRVEWTDDVKAYTLPEWLYNCQVMGIYEDPGVGGKSTPGDLLRLRVYSRDRYEGQQGIISARSREQGTGKESLWSQKFGKWSDYKSDGKTPMTVRFEWKDGGASFTGVKGQTVSCPNDCKKQIDNLRYVALGGDGSGPCSALGMRFLGARLIDLDKGPPPPARNWAAADIHPQKQPQLPVETVPAPARRRVVFDVDFTKGPTALPKNAWIRGGAWDGGWEVKADRERIVFDPGYWIRNGALEVTMTRRDVPLSNEKVDVISLHESPNIDHTDAHGDAIVLRIGAAEVNMGLQAGIKTFLKERNPVHFGEGWGKRYGAIEDWKLDGKTPHTFRLEWKNGRVKFTDFMGRTFACEKDCDNHMDRLRFIAIGGDRYNGGPSLIGARFLRIKLEDLDAPAGP